MQAFATPENPDLVRAQNELAALRSELARVETGRGGDSLADMAIRKVPEAGLEYLRRLRELKYREAVLEALTKQYEIARIDEAKDAAVIQVLDKALPPEVRSAPKRSLIVLTTAFLALCLAAMIALFAERVRDNPVVIARLQLLKFRLLGRSIS
ncbi:MAG TPA: GNVR domain-containing protein, partial [Candidatus Limnocylindrales bacterium]|nr:GNVR domain-containing protein [Candidatus Limnocylindrales bacterium]